MLCTLSPHADVFTVEVALAVSHLLLSSANFALTLQLTSMRQSLKYRLLVLELLSGSEVGKFCRILDLKRRFVNATYHCLKTAKVRAVHARLTHLTPVTVRGPIFRKADQNSEGVDFHTHMMPCQFNNYLALAHLTIIFI